MENALCRIHDIVKVSLSAHALIWLARRVQELAAISRKVERGQEVSVGATRQWTAIVDKVVLDSGLIAIVSKFDEQ